MFKHLEIVLYSAGTNPPAADSTRTTLRFAPQHIVGFALNEQPKLKTCALYLYLVNQETPIEIDIWSAHDQTVTPALTWEQIVEQARAAHHRITTDWSKRMRLMEQE